MTPVLPAAELVAAVRAAGGGAGALVGLAVGVHGTVGLCVGEVRLASADGAAAVAAIEREVGPRWVIWSGATASALLASGIRVHRAWDLLAVHRILFGGWRADPVRIWCRLHGLDHERGPVLGQLDLLGGSVDDDGDPSLPTRRDGFLRPEWVAGAWATHPAAAAEWAATALAAALAQQQRLGELSVAGDVLALARAESTAELLCAELAHDGLPVDVPTAEAIMAASVGPRPRHEAEAAAGRAARDAAVLAHLVVPTGIDLRSPTDVKAMLRRVGIDVPDTRAWRLEAMRDQHPVVDALLTWRKAERIATTFGYGWLDANVGHDGRLRGEWSGSDGAAGRMTAQAGLHNLPAELRPAVRAEPGHVFVRADLGQIEPRVLAAVSRDTAFIRAAQEDDLYAPVATRLGVDRPAAKIAVLAAMYGQTSGTAGQALRGMETAYPVAMKYLSDAATVGMEGRELRTYGGRLIRMYDIENAGDYRSAAAARGRYARNALVQGAAAELFKVWAVTVRARGADLGARIVLCLHDELLVHCPEANGAAVAQLLVDCLHEASTRWQQGAGVRFVADVSIVQSWADAKA
ncbi:MAG: DNA polymerase [Actinomycetota bacterium]|nr:DNA polymerase [Actinomycetota bacterium]